MKVLPIAGVLLVLLACGGIYIMLQAKKSLCAEARSGFGLYRG